MLLLLSSIAIAVVLPSLVQYVGGNQRTLHVSELISDDEDLVTSSGDGSGVDSILLCCKYENGYYLLFDDALGDLTSNVLLNVTTDVMLSSYIAILNLENVSIVGHNNPTVNCTGVGGIHFISCHSCTIQGITWDGCGTNVEPGLKLSDSSNITIQDCSFQHSIGQAVVLSNISGYVNINHCKFVNNNHYRGHGAAISYSSSNITDYPPLLFTICNCNFTHNKGAKSYVYIKNGRSRHINLCDSKFYHNKGASIYAVNYNLYLNGKNLFQNNTAEDGAGIYISAHSTVIFGRNSDVAFIENSAHHSGGAIYISIFGNIVFTDNSFAVFSNNNAELDGGAMYNNYLSIISFEGNSNTQFTNNNVERYGGAIRSFSSSIYFKDNSNTEFTNNNAEQIGGAILTENRYYFRNYIFHGIYFKDNSTAKFINNNAKVVGWWCYIQSLYRSTL